MTVLYNWLLLNNIEIKGENFKKIIEFIDKGKVNREYDQLIDQSIITDRYFDIILWAANHLLLLLIFCSILLAIAKILFMLISIAYFTLAERKVMGAIQRRKGPNRVGVYGLIQPIADGLKLLTKEVIIPTHANTNIFIFAPLFVLTLSLIAWVVIPFGLTGGWEYITEDYIYNKMTIIKSKTEFNEISYTNYGIFCILILSSFNVYGIILAGWASNSKYAFLGSLRSSAQMISYEIYLGLIILPVILLAGSLNFTNIILVQQQTVWFCCPLIFCTIVFFISILAETNRAPFDLPEAEAELVAGYNVEYSSLTFALFFLSEYSNMLLMNAIICIFFFGGWLPTITYVNPAIILSIKIIIGSFLFILIRASLPRLRYDQLMDLGWKEFLPLVLGFLFLFVSVIFITKNSQNLYNIKVMPFTNTLFFNKN